MQISARRLTSKDKELAQRLFSLMSEVLEERQHPLPEAYLTNLLASEAFWAVAAFSGNEILGGLTAHTLPMTRSESSEIFIYDIAVHPAHQRKGVGKALVARLREYSEHVVFVPADNEDAHAVDFYRALGGTPASVTFFTFE